MVLHSVQERKQAAITYRVEQNRIFHCSCYLLPIFLASCCTPVSVSQIKAQMWRFAAKCFSPSTNRRESGDSAAIMWPKLGQDLAGRLFSRRASDAAIQKTVAKSEQELRQLGAIRSPKRAGSRLRRRMQARKSGGLCRSSGRPLCCDWHYWLISAFGHRKKSA